MTSLVLDRVKYPGVKPFYTIRILGTITSWLESCTGIAWPQVTGEGPIVTFFATARL
jgi:hypothetical protein